MNRSTHHHRQRQTTCLRRLRDARKGAATVEFALCFPILMAVVFGAVEMSRAQQVYHTIRQAAYEGARAGITTDGTAADATNAAQRILDANGVGGATIVVTPSTITSATTSVTVAISADVNANGWVRWNFATGSLMTASVTLDSEHLSISVPPSSGS